MIQSLFSQFCGQYYVVCFFYCMWTNLTTSTRFLRLFSLTDLSTNDERMQKLVEKHHKIHVPLLFAVKVFKMCVMFSLFIAGCIYHAPLMQLNIEMLFFLMCLMSTLFWCIYIVCVLTLQFFKGFPTVENNYLPTFWCS